MIQQIADTAVAALTPSKADDSALDAVAAWLQRAGDSMESLSNKIPTVRKR